MMLFMSVFGENYMTLTHARSALIALSFSTALATLLFFLLAHFFIQLSPTESYGIAQLVTPVFCGYIGSCISFIFVPTPVNPTVNNQFLLLLLVYGPFVFFWVASIAFVLNFYYSNRAGILVEYKTLNSQFTYLLSFMTLTTGALTVHLFGKKEA